jgi:NADPH2 dehydrogenase
MPNELTFSQINDIVEAFKAAAVRANAAGFDAIEIHAAHGYLVHEFLSPITNQRNDEYGGSLDNRVRFLREILKGVHSVWPADKLIWVRVSAFDYQQGGIDGDMMVQIINKIKPFIDLVHVSSGGLLPIMVDDYPGYQIPLSERIRKECGKPTITVGLITNEEMAEEILQDGRADLVALGRELLRSPYWPVNVAAEHGISGYVPEPYHRAFRKNKLYETEVLL